MTRAMYDSVTAARLPADATLVACYVDGHYANEAAVRARCPHATVVRITVLGHAGAHVADVETGDLTPESGATWAANEIKAGRQPTLYCNTSTWPEVKQHVAAHGVSGKVAYFIADYDGKAEMIPGAVAHQWQERKDQNLDYSVAADYWPGVDPKPVAAQAVSQPKPVTVPTKEPRMIVRFAGHPDVYEVVGSHLEHITSQAYAARGKPAVTDLPANHPLAALPKTNGAA